MGASIVIRDIDSIDEMRVVEDLEKEVWALDDRDITPVTQLVASKATGGQLLGAFDGRNMIGFVFGFIGLDRGRTVHHSHMLAVKAEYRNADVGYRLKLAQRERVLAQGIDRITWTFDPLQSSNAYFNFCKLGVVSDAYKINFYGAETSSFLHRAGTDRLWLTWLLDSVRVRDRLKGKSSAKQSGEQAFIEIPSDINALQRENPEQVLEWRNSTRRAFTEAFEKGYIVEDFFRRSGGEHPVGVFVLSRGRIEDFA